MENNERLRQEQEEAIRRYREAINKSLDNDKKIGEYAYNKDRNETEMQRLRDLGRQYDADEKAAKAEYERLNCQSVTACTSEGFRHETVVDKRVEERNEERMRCDKEHEHHL